MVRLFTCIWIPKTLTEKILAVQKDIIADRIKIKLVEKRNLHVTMNFLGNVENNKIGETKMKLRDITNVFNSFHVNLEGLKLIPNERHIRVIGIRVISDELPLITEMIGNSLGGKFHKKSKLTLCRVKKISDKKYLKNFIDKYRNVKIGKFHVKKISLVKSRLTKSGPIYKTLYEGSLNERK